MEKYTITHEEFEKARQALRDADTIEIPKSTEKDGYLEIVDNTGYTFIIDRP